ncbi:U3 snoRNP protein [Rhodotorula toruloides]|uniref:RHTO0S10e00144g1_1 n=2 Tax=Rhodotorula toruloides TaxID=5286 RepID=A0A061BA62_RHOTO|nr:pre-rrna processing protein Utp22 [Rhodotorula toruloides NP11]EMS18542.1 pre-rrna processing protein Utp22 [Rhodotorula toruloides NP11]CDR44771.1 RHTO0S10e00144g1_1 [Rhodotorula toruloides]
MARSAKRTAPAATTHAAKKARTAPARRDEAGELDGDESEVNEFEGLGGSDETMSGEEDSLDDNDGLLEALDGQESDEEDEEDSIAGDGQDEGSDMDNQMISDDGEDLYANLDREMGDEEDEDEEDEDEEEDQDDDGGWETVGTAPSAPLIAPAAALDKKRKAKAAKKLSPAELRALAFAELTASPISNVLSTQVSALLDSLSPAASSSSALQPILKDLHTHITSLPKQKAVSLDGLRKKGRVVPPVEGHNGKWAKMDLAWEKPRSEDLRVTGAWAWGGGYKEKGEYIVEIAVAMPQSLFQPKDYLFPRFSVKAAHYLVVLASLLPSSLGPVRTSFFPLPGSLGYALDIRTAVKKGEEKVGLAKAKGAVLRIRIVAPATVFPTNKLTPTGNVVRPPSLLASTEGDNPQLDPASLPPTPLHSTALHLSTLSLSTTHLKYHHSLATSYPAYASSVRLLRNWAQRRGYDASLGLTSDWWAWCVARSLNVGGKSAAGDVASLAAGGEAWAGWRKAVEWLASANWTEGIWFKSMTDETYSKDEFRRAFKGKPLLVDPTGTVNLAAGIELSTLETLKQDAKETISLLLAGIEDERKFDSAFAREVRVTERFDNFARIVVPANPKVDADAAVDHPNSLSYLVSLIHSTLSRALGTRARAFRITLPPTPSLSTSAPAPKASSAVTLSLGLILDPSDSLRLVDQGPSAEDEEACADFRAFWGAKSELRRFKDGAIVESVVWDEPSADGLGPQRSTIVRRIVEYILGERHGVPAANIDFFAGGMDHLVVEPLAVRRQIYLEDSVATGKGFTNVITAFDDIVKEMKELPDLPLGVASVQPCSPGLRYSSTFTPSARRLKDFERLPHSLRYIEAHDMLLTLESSGRWPDDLEGIQKIKAAFLSKIGEGLEATRSVLRAEVVFDVDARSIDDNVALEILTATGWAFRARIFYDRSQLLLEEREEQLGDAVNSSAIASPLELYQQRFVHAPKHHAAISTLQHHFPFFSLTVRLFKRWVSSHMLSGYFADEQLELLVASVFIDPATTFNPPSSGATGFARVMERLASWKWRDEPLLVPIYTFTSAVTSGRRAVLPTTKKAQAVSSFQELRLAKPNIDEHAWIIATEEDVEGTVWGVETNKVVAARIRGLARATLATLEDGVVRGGLVVEQLFSPPLADYAFLVHLDASRIPRHFQALSPESAALASRSRSSVLSGSMMGDLEEEDDDIRVGWDPVADFVDQLNRLYPSVFLLFHSEHGSPIIGGIWHPSVESPRAFSVGLSFAVKPVVAEEGKAKVVLDKKAVFREIERVGKGLVVKVEEPKR